MRENDVRADCARCAGLCCVCLAFDASSRFAIDKPLNTPCPHLGVTMQCNIHAERVEQGFTGCIDYDCLGAGQRVVQELFFGQSFRQRPELLPQMCEAFHQLVRVQQLTQLLHEAGRLELPHEPELERLRLLVLLEPKPRWSRLSLSELPLDGMEQQVKSFLRGLRPWVPRSRSLPVRMLPVVRASSADSFGFDAKRP